MTETDGTLARAARRGDHAAFAELYCDVPVDEKRQVVVDDHDRHPLEVQIEHYASLDGPDMFIKGTNTEMGAYLAVEAW